MEAITEFLMSPVGQTLLAAIVAAVAAIVGNSEALGGERFKWLRKGLGLAAGALNKSKTP